MIKDDSLFYTIEKNKEDISAIKIPVFSIGECQSGYCSYVGELGDNLCQSCWDQGCKVNLRKLHKSYRVASKKFRFNIMAKKSLNMVEYDVREDNSI